MVSGPGPSNSPHPTPDGHRATDTPHGEIQYGAIQQTEDFQDLKRTLRRFVFPATAIFLCWYLLYVLLTVYARNFMDQKVFGNVNVAYVFGLLQFVSTFVIAYVYSRFADTHLDPKADRIRSRAEGASS